MAKPLNVTAGIWWRFSRYKVRNNHIRPAPGAKLEEYDPWEEYRASLNPRLNVPPPYQTFLSLQEGVFKLSSPWDLLTDEFTLGQEAETLVLEWCKTYGLLGILPQAARKVELAAYWGRPGDELEDAEEPTLIPTLCDHSRDGAQWVRNIWQPPTRTHITDLKRRGQPLSRAESHAEASSDLDWPISEPGVVWEKWDDPMEPGLPMPKERLDEEWVSYFPTVPRRQAQTYLYPRPLSEDFWHLYAEPVPRFMTHALRLKFALQFLTEKKPRSMAEGLDILQGLLNSISLTAKLSKDYSLRQRWSAPSLLASFAMMALQDLTAESLLECKTCKRLFTSTHPNAAYCTPRCRKRADMRRFRNEQKKKKSKEHPRGRKG